MSEHKRVASPRQRPPSNDEGGASRVAVENVNHPGKTRFVDAANYRAMRLALGKVLPSRDPGLTYEEMLRAVLPHLPIDLFPGGARAGWWLKTVQLDLEAKQVIAREKVTPLRFHRSSRSTSSRYSRTRRSATVAASAAG